MAKNKSRIGILEKLILRVIIIECGGLFLPVIFPVKEQKFYKELLGLDETEIEYVRKDDWDKNEIPDYDVEYKDGRIQRYWNVRGVPERIEELDLDVPEGYKLERINYSEPSK
jgi:hypothetical protein